MLAAGCGWPIRTVTGCSLPAVTSAKCGTSCLSLVKPCVVGRIGGGCDMPVEALFPQGRQCFELGFSCWSRVLGIDAVSGPPHGDLTKEGGA
jgi:hypothetical protein